MIDAVRYVVDNGVKWANLPADFPSFKRVHAFARRWQIGGLLAELHDRLHDKVREKEGRKAGQPVHPASLPLAVPCLQLVGGTAGEQRNPVARRHCARVRSPRDQRTAQQAPHHRLHRRAGRRLRTALAGTDVVPQGPRRPCSSGSTACCIIWPSVRMRESRLDPDRCPHRGRRGARRPRPAPSGRLRRDHRLIAWHRTLLRWKWRQKARTEGTSADLRGAHRTDPAPGQETRSASRANRAARATASAPAPSGALCAVSGLGLAPRRGRRGPGTGPTGRRFLKCPGPAYSPETFPSALRNRDRRRHRPRRGGLPHGLLRRDHRARGRLVLGWQGTRLPGHLEALRGG
ncbi:transposase [Streptomyces sp. NPDC001292]|uniref:transposase n=1 Tax=Streptomyces sp. NPDC001292 TaxID=3364558 RepID=UPI0036C2BF01